MREDELADVQDGDPMVTAETGGTRPGANGGGKLKSGNTKGVGRKPSEVRAKYLAGADAAAKFMQDVAMGKKCIPIQGQMKDGKQVFRYPSFKERMEASDKCLKYGLGTKQELTSGDEPIKAYINIDTDRI